MDTLWNGNPQAGTGFLDGNRGRMGGWATPAKSAVFHLLGPPLAKPAAGTFRALALRGWPGGRPQQATVAPVYANCCVRTESCAVCVLSVERSVAVPATVPVQNA